MDDTNNAGDGPLKDAGATTPPPASPPPPPAEAAPEVEGEDVTAPSKADDRTGIALDGDYPHNHRLRAEALAREGRDKDPDGMIGPELIADAKARLEGDDAARAAEAAARPSIAVNMKVEDLVAIATKEEVDLDGAANNQERVDRIEAARAAAGSSLVPTLPTVDEGGNLIVEQEA